MSLLAKILGISAVLVIGLVFVLIINLGYAYLHRWRQKGINPNQSFPRNPQGGELSEDQQRALNVGAILSGVNSDFCNSLQTSKAVAKKTIEEFMARDWGISSAEEALERLEELKFSGHRQINGFILQKASDLLVPGAKLTVEPRDVYEQAGFSLLDKRVLLEYPNEVALAEKHIDLLDELLKASSFEDVKEHQALFGDEKTFSYCIQIYHQFYEKCLVYASRLVNLEQTLPDLRKEGYLGKNLSELERIDVAAWDMGRIVNVARYSYDLGYISESIAWDYISFAARDAAMRYADWADFAKSYLIGRAMWGGKNVGFYLAMSMVKELKEDRKSPWALVPLH